MKFKLFERLRDSGSSDTGTTSSPAQTGGLGEPEFGDDDSAPASGGPPAGGSLERTVENMFDQGYSEDEIKDELQGQYSEQEIQTAVNQTVTNNATSSDGPEPMTPYQSDDEPVSPMDEGYDDQQPEEQQTQRQGGQSIGGQNQGMQQTQPQPQQQQTQQKQLEPLPQEGEEGGGQSGPVDQRVEQLIETIVAENFQRVTKEFENVYEELDILEEELEDLEKRVHDLEVRDDEDHEQFVQKVDEMEEHIDSYQSRIGGLEKAFQQVLPNLVDNVRDLTGLVQEIKQEKGIETETNVSEKDMEQMDEELQDW
jgi:hypothetical protein